MQITKESKFSKLYRKYKNLCNQQMVVANNLLRDKIENKINQERIYDEVFG